MQASELREQLQQGGGADLRRRRGIIGLSLIGAASMAAVTLLQTGIVKHLPDPPLPGFNSDKVNSSDTSYALGAPDGTLSLASLTANMPLSAFGGIHRAEEHPCIPIAFAVKAGIEAAAASWYFYQMPAKENAWCPYCIVGTLANLGILALAIPEARHALRHLSAHNVNV